MGFGETVRSVTASNNCDGRSNLPSRPRFYRGRREVTYKTFPGKQLRAPRFSSHAPQREFIDRGH